MTVRGSGTRVTVILPTHIHVWPGGFPEPVTTGGVSVLAFSVLPVSVASDENDRTMTRVRDWRRSRLGVPNPSRGG